MQINEWWQQVLAGHRQDGRDDADKGVFEAPYPIVDDQSEADENEAYRAGFNERR